jgi:hypothetical protein
MDGEAAEYHVEKKWQLKKGVRAQIIKLGFFSL